MSLYAYCLSDEVTLEMIGSGGVAEATIRLIETRGITAVVSDFDGAMVPLSRDNVLAHERVVASILSTVTPLPFRFGTLVSQEQLESYIEINFKKLVSGLERVRGSVEMSVKILVSEAKDHKKSSDLESFDAANAGPGSRFLMQKRRELEQDESLKEQSEEIAKWLAELVDGYVRESVVRLRPGGALALAASYLVERSRIGEYRHRVANGFAERSTFRFLTSGPWPPYSFCDLSA